MVKVDHSKTEEAIGKIIATLHGQAAALETYLKEMDNGKDQAMYSAEYLKGLADRALEKLVDTAQKNRDIFDAQLQLARDCESENDAALDFTDATLQGILAAIDALQDGSLTVTGDGINTGGLSGAGRIVEAALEELRGQQNALELVKNKLMSKGYELIEPWEKDYFYTGDLFAALEDQLVGVTQSPKSSTYYLNAAKEIRVIARKLGLSIKDGDLDFGENLGGLLYNDALRISTGLQSEF